MSVQFDDLVLDTIEVRGKVFISNGSLRNALADMMMKVQHIPDAYEALRVLRGTLAQLDR